METNDRLIRLPEVLHIRGESRSSFYAKVKRGQAPVPIKIGARAVAWSLDEIIEDLEKLKAARDSEARASE